MDTQVVDTLSPFAIEIWLLGSRANNCAKPDSDWDFLVVCTDDQVDFVIQNANLQTWACMCDFLITTDKKCYLKRPWLQEEKRNFVEWEWIEEDSGATYKGQKFVADSGDDLAEMPEQFRGNTGNIESMSLRAIRLYP